MTANERWLAGALVAVLAWLALVIVEDANELRHRVTLLEREQTYLMRSARELVRLHTSTQHGIGVAPSVEIPTEPDSRAR